MSRSAWVAWVEGGNTVEVRRFDFATVQPLRLVHIDCDLYSSTNTANAPYDLDSLNQGSGTSTFARSNAKAYAGSWSLNAAMSTYGLVGFNNIEYVRSLPTQITLS